MQTCALFFFHFSKVNEEDNCRIYRLMRGKLLLISQYVFLVFHLLDLLGVYGGSLHGPIG
jgi:hypothetical protein